MGGKVWTAEEINILTREYEQSSKQHLLTLLPNRSWSSIQDKAWRLSLSRVDFRKQVGPKNYFWMGGKKETYSCKMCGKEFRRFPSQSPKFCSTECYHKWDSINKRGRNNPRWRKIGKNLKCEWCGKEFDRTPFHATKYNARFCSKRCFGKYKISLIQHDEEIQRKRVKGLVKKPTKPEQRLIDVIEENSLPFKYVGDGTIIVNGLNPDFIESNGKKKVIEVFGRVFHDPRVSFVEVHDYQTEEGRRAFFANYGYDCLIFWDDELDDEKNVIRRINEFIDGSEW